MKLAKYIGAILIILFVILTYYPIKQFYRFDTLKVGKYKKNTNQIVEVSKAFFLLPGKKSLWALKTETGYEVYTTLSDVNSQRKIIFQIYNEDLEKYKNDPSVYAQIEKTISRSGIKKYDRNGNTSLIKAIYNNDVQNVRGLIEDGADVNRFDKKSHYNPLLLAVASKEVDLEIIEVLLSNGADINLANKDGYFALPFLAHSSSGRVEAAKLLLKYGADVNALTNHAYYRGPYNDYSKEESPLLLAIDKNPGDLAMFLIESGANIHIKDQKNKTLLFGVKDAKVAKYLLDNGLDPNAKDTFNRAPLYFAHDGEIVKLLLEYGANIESRDNNDVTVMFSGSWNKKPDAKLAMIAAGANLNLKNREGRSLLYTVHEPVVYKELLVKGLNVNDKDKFGMTPLHYVCKEHWGEKQTLLTELLIAYGADVNAMDDSGMMPLDYAKGNNTKNLLISNGAKTTRPNESGLNS